MPSCQQALSGNCSSEAEATSQAASLPRNAIVPNEFSLAGTPTGRGLTHLIRAARPEDLSSITTLLTESFYASSGSMGWLLPLLRLGIYQDLRGRLDSTVPNRICLVAALRNTAPRTSSHLVLAGTIEVAVRPLSAWEFSLPKFPYISNLAVKADCRRQGVAQDLLQTCEQAVIDWGFRDLYLHVLDNNNPARQLYAKAGYQLYRVDPLWTTYLLRQPQRLLLHKRLQ